MAFFTPQTAAARRSANPIIGKKTGGVYRPASGSVGKAAPGQIYQAPPDMSGAYPAFTEVSFPTIDPAKYNFTDPTEFAKQFGEFNRGEFAKNFAQAKDMALGALDTELQGLKQYAPAAAALKREQIAVDNPFNQAQRTAQVNAAMPGARSTLDAQASRARAYAEGRLPDANLDRAFEMGVRSKAADSASFSGFGSKSAQASKLSDLMSADQRLQISQFGEGLTTQNLTTEAGLFLAPTEYANTGAEISAKPEVGAGRLTYQGAGMINEATLLNPATALSSKIQQEQFKTQLEQRTNEFNATGTFDAAKYNSAGSFTAGLGLFNYQTGLASTVAGVNSANNGANVQMQLMAGQAGATTSGISAGQSSSDLQQVSSAVGAVAGVVGGEDGASGGTSNTNSSGGTVVGKSGATFDTSANESTTAPLTDTSTSLPSSYAMIPGAVGADATTPSSVKFQSGASVPEGYVPVSGNSDGTVSAASISDYTAELSRFAQSSGIQATDISVQNAALADKTLSQTVGLSYVPVPGFQPLALSSSGKQIYSNPAVANSSDATLGVQNAASLGSILGSLGVADEKVSGAIGEVVGALADPATLHTLDLNFAENGQAAVTQTILNTIVGGKPDLKTEAGQQLSFMAHRIGEIWGSLSPAQKSLALSSMAGQAINLKAGKDVTKELVPGSKNSVAGGLRAGDAMAVMASGKNGQSLARNWSQLSVLGKVASGSRGVTQIAGVADMAGALGYGPQGAAEKIDSKYLSAMGAKPAPEYGIGATQFSRAAHIPSNYKMVGANANGVIAVPKSLAHTSVSNTPHGHAKSREVAEGTHPAMKSWGPAPLKGVRGSQGGSALAAAHRRLRESDPDINAALAAYSLFNSTMGRSG